MIKICGLIIALLICCGYAHSTPQIAETIAIAEINGKDKTLQEKISQAITQFENTNKNRWAYQVSRFENEEGTITSSIERFEPNTGKNAQPEKQWTLLQMNDKAPTKQQQIKFRDSKLKQAKSKQAGSHYSFVLREIIDIDSLVFFAENDTHMQMSFDVYIEKLGDDAKGKLQGKLFYNKHQHLIEEIVIKNNAEFSPMFSANITDLTLTFNFISINDNILPKQHGMKMKGTFAFFTEINETSTDTFSDYVFVNSQSD